MIFQWTTSFTGCIPSLPLLCLRTPEAAATWPSFLEVAPQSWNATLQEFRQSMAPFSLHDISKAFHIVLLFDFEIINTGGSQKKIHHRRSSAGDFHSAKAPKTMPGISHSAPRKSCLAAPLGAFAVSALRIWPIKFGCSSWVSRFCILAILPRQNVEIDFNELYLFGDRNLQEINDLSNTSDTSWQWFDWN